VRQRRGQAHPLAVFREQPRLLAERAENEASELALADVGERLRVAADHEAHERGDAEVAFDELRRRDRPWWPERFFIVPQGRSGLLLVQWHGRKHWPLPVEPLTPAALVEAEHDRSRTLSRAQVVPRLLDRLRL
jgi:hypothetical protein